MLRLNQWANHLFYQEKQFISGKRIDLNGALIEPHGTNHCCPKRCTSRGYMNPRKPF